MPGRLDRLLDSIHPSRTLDETARRAEEAVNSFAKNASQITDWEEFRTYASRFFCHVEESVLRMRNAPQFDEEFAWDRCLKILKRAFGPNGEKAAFEMARTGNEGGLYAVLKKVAQTMAEQYARNEVAGRVYAYWNELTVEQQLAAGQEYLDKYGHLLPSELTEHSGARVRANLPRVLEKHPDLMQRLGEIGRS